LGKFGDGPCAGFRFGRPAPKGWEPNRPVGHGRGEGVPWARRQRGPRRRRRSRRPPGPRRSSPGPRPPPVAAGSRAGARNTSGRGPGGSVGPQQDPLGTGLRDTVRHRGEGGCEWRPPLDHVGKRFRYWACLRVETNKDTTRARAPSLAHRAEGGEGTDRQGGRGEGEGEGGGWGPMDPPAGLGGTAPRPQIAGGAGTMPPPVGAGDPWTRRRTGPIGHGQGVSVRWRRGQIPGRGSRTGTGVGSFAQGGDQGSSESRRDPPPPRAGRTTPSAPRG